CAGSALRRAGCASMTRSLSEEARRVRSRRGTVAGPGENGAWLSAMWCRRADRRGVRVRVRQIVVSFVAAVATVVALSACVPRAHIDAAEPSKNSDATESATFVAVIDGDTIETSAGTVRLIGID